MNIALARTIDRPAILPTILVVDDEPKARHGLARLLRGHNYRVRIAASGKKAVQKASEMDRELCMVLMDIKLGGEWDGIDAAQEIQSRYPKVSKFFVTAFSDSADYRRRVKEAHLEIADWIDKPIVAEHKDRLLQRIDEEICRMQLESLTEISGSYGVHVFDALSLAQEIAQQLDHGATGQKMQKLQRMLMMQRAAEVLSEVESIIHRLQRDFDDLTRRQLEYGKLKDVIMGSLWRAFLGHDREHRQIAVLIRMAIRRSSSLDLIEQHVEAIAQSLAILRQDTVEPKDIDACKATLRRSGLETLIVLGDRLDELQEIYDSYSEQ